ncbi:PucR family transcriptional regulator [Parasphingorhabdus pacifica]
MSVEVVRDGDAAAGAAARLARSLLIDLDGVTDRLIADILNENPSYHAAAPDLRSSCRANLGRVLELLGGRVPDGDDPYDAARETGRRRAEQRAPLDLVLRSFRLGGRVVWASALQAARDEGDVDPETLLDVGTSVWTVVDGVSSKLSDSYRRTELELLRVDEQRRRVLVDELFRGAGEDPAFANTALRTLGLPEAGPYVVLVGEGIRGRVELVSPEETLARQWIRSVWRIEKGMLTGLVALEGRPAESVAEALIPDLCTRVGASPVLSGIGGVVAARELAATALRTLPKGSPGAVSLDSRLPQAVLVRSPDLAERLVDRTLGPLLALPAAERDLLLETLDAWLAANRSAKLAATGLFCHRNTVLNRIGRIEALLDRSVHGVEDAVWLSLALQARQLRDGA